MSDDRKRNARLQGKFSDPKESRSGHRDKHKEKKNSQNQNSAEDNEEHKKGQASKSRTAEGMNLEYQEDSKYTFKEQLTEKKKYIEIRNGGVHEISITENGLSRIIYEPNYLDGGEADEFFVILRDSTAWYDKNIVIRGQEYPQPRLVSWYGPYPYSYSGATLEPAEMPNIIIGIKKRVEHSLKLYGMDVEFNSVLLNFYRNGKDSVSWHSDDEPTMGIQPTIASISLGEVRAFQMRPKSKTQAGMIDKDTRYQVNLESGSLFIMDGCMQKDWEHQVPKEYHDRDQRINLTFRSVYLLKDIPTEVPCSIKESEESGYNSKASQSKPIYDSNNFPPLNPAGSVSNKTNPETQNNSTCQIDSTIGNRKVATEIESAIDANANANKNSVTEASANSEGSANELVDYDSAKDKAEATFIDAKSPFPEDRAVNSSKNDLEDLDKAICTSRNKHKLNVNAPDFVPFTGFHNSFRFLSLRELSDFFSKCTDETCESEEFVLALTKTLIDVNTSRDCFSIRDWEELETYIKLSNGVQGVENQRVINKRIFTIVNNKYHSRKNMSQRNHRGRNHQRAGYRLR